MTLQMTKSKLLVLLFCFLGFQASSIATDLNDKLVFDHWKAGSIVSHLSVEKYCDGRCFVSEPISKETFSRMSGKSFPSDCTVPVKDLRLVKLLHYTADGRIRLGELVVNRVISEEIIEIFEELFAVRYPIEKMLLIDEYEADDIRSMTDNNSSAFNFRYVAGTKKLSNHSRGMAVDINPLFNPFVLKGKHGLIISPKAGASYADRSRHFTYKINPDDACVRAFKKRGFEWGGDWKTRKDYQHFEKVSR